MKDSTYLTLVLALNYLSKSIRAGGKLGTDASLLGIDNLMANQVDEARLDIDALHAAANPGPTVEITEHGNQVAKEVSGWTAAKRAEQSARAKRMWKMRRRNKGK